LYLLEAMKRIREEVHDAHLYIIGKGPEEQNLRSLTEKLELSSVVTFLTRPIPNHEISALYAECDLYVQPSIVEPYGIAVLEAMACGKPVVGTRVGGMLDTVEDGETGFLVDSGNVKEMADRIMVLKDRNKRTEMRIRAREWVVSKFDWMVVGKKYQEVIRELV